MSLMLHEMLAQSGYTTTFQHVEHNGSGMWLAGGRAQSTLLRSFDGITWQQMPWNFAHNPANLAYGNGVWVAGGGNQCAVSYDNGETWSGPYTCGRTGTVSLDISFGNGVFVMSGNSAAHTADAVWTSPDGINWTERLGTVPGQQYYEAYWNGTTWVVGCNHTKSVYVSTDNVNWTVASIAPTNLWDMTWAGGMWVFCGNGGVIRTSTNLTTFTARTSGVVTDLQGIAYGAGLFVVSGHAGVILTSPDGINWTQRVSGTTSNLQDVTWNGSHFLACGAGNQILRSTDGITWTSVS